MSLHKSFIRFEEIVSDSIDKENLVLLRISNKREDSEEIKQVLIRLVKLKKGIHLSFVYRYPTKDITKNFSIEEACQQISELLQKNYFQAELETEESIYYLSLFKNGHAKLRQKLNPNASSAALKHNHQKERMIESKDNIYLQKLGITSSTFEVKSKMQDKYKQINKYIEIIHDILKKTKLPEDAHIVDMGSGKGYLTFALYDYFKNIRKENPHIVGVEIRKDLVEICNRIAKEANFDELDFENGSIQEHEQERIDFLIALHACDTATDDAIFKGIKAGAPLIICAPCCHKQVRKNMHTEGVLENITQHGILKERQAEILTDSIRSLYLQAYGYQTRVFEFISTSHTPKNVLIVASLNEKREEADSRILHEIQQLKNLYGLSHHHLEKLFGHIQKETKEEN